jgi:hypothetical protein
MSQKLSVLIQRFPWDKFPTIKTKAQIRRAASIKAARTLKRKKYAARAASEAGKMERAA